MRLTFFVLFYLFSIVQGGLSNSYAKETEKIKEDSYRGWGYIVHNLLERGHSKELLRKVYLNKRMPRFSLVPFSVKPKESPRIYDHFLDKKLISAAQRYMKKYRTSFTKAENHYDLEKEIMASIILIETNFGSYTGNHRVIFRVSRLANANSPDNLRKNHARLLKEGEEVTFKEVQDRGQYLFDLFLPEIEAALDIAKTKRFSVFAMKGSSAGA